MGLVCGCVGEIYMKDSCCFQAKPKWTFFCLAASNGSWLLDNIDLEAARLSAKTHTYLVRTGPQCKIGTMPPAWQLIKHGTNNRHPGVRGTPPSQINNKRPPDKARDLEQSTNAMRLLGRLNTPRQPLNDQLKRVLANNLHSFPAQTADKEIATNS